MDYFQFCEARNLFRRRDQAVPILGRLMKAKSPCSRATGKTLSSRGGEGALEGPRSHISGFWEELKVLRRLPPNPARERLRASPGTFIESVDPPRQKRRTGLYPRERGLDALKRCDSLSYPIIAKSDFVTALFFIAHILTPLAILGGDFFQGRDVHSKALLTGVTRERRQRQISVR